MTHHGRALFVQPWHPIVTDATIFVAGPAVAVLPFAFSGTEFTPCFVFLVSVILSKFALLCELCTRLQCVQGAAFVANRAFIITFEILHHIRTDSLMHPDEANQAQR